MASRLIAGLEWRSVRPALLDQTEQDQQPAPRLDDGRDGDGEGAGRLVVTALAAPTDGRPESDNVADEKKRSFLPRRRN